MNERDMDAPVTRREMHEALEMWAGAIIEKLTEKLTAFATEIRAETRAMIKTTETVMITRMEALFDPHRGIPERMSKLESEELPARVRTLEAKVFAPKRRTSKRVRRP